MKKLIPVILLFASVFVFSCNTIDDPLDVSDEETIEVAIKLSGLDLTETMEPITRSGESVIYFFAVVQDGKPYAWYCMDSFNDVTISLVKDHTYDFVGYIAYDIKGAYYWSVNVGNSISYLQTGKSNGFEYSDSMRYHLDYPLRDYNYKMLVCSETYSSIPETVVLNMYNAYFGIKANASNLDGSLEITLGKESNGSFAYDYSLFLTKDQPSVTEYIHFLYPVDVAKYTKEGNDYTRDVDITIKYTDTDNNTSILHTGQITVSRMKYTILDIKMNDNLNNQSRCALSLEDGSFSDGKKVELEF